ncbi:MAG: GNAT family N-acetyltransferase [Puia sp.]|nr:GNAT family N-acetyltransferase [Puia sp.]
MDTIAIRLLQSGDNKAMAAIIRSALAEFGANKPGTVYYDETTDHLSGLFAGVPKSIYYVALVNEQLAGGGGIYPSDGLPEDTCELVKMYLAPAARGLGLGRALIEKCLQTAKDTGFRRVYLETMPELKKAVSVYEKFGFRFLDGPLGNTGHFGCGIWMLKDL